MATKKKVATKVVPKKTANIKKAEPAKKAANPVSSVAASKSLSKNGTKSAEKVVTVPVASTRKVIHPAAKASQKHVPKKATKPAPKNAIPLKTEQVKKEISSRSLCVFNYQYFNRTY